MSNKKTMSLYQVINLLGNNLSDKVENELISKLNGLNGEELALVAQSLKKEISEGNEIFIGDISLYISHAQKIYKEQIIKEENEKKIEKKENTQNVFTNEEKVIIKNDLKEFSSIYDSLSEQEKQQYKEVLDEVFEIDEDSDIKKIQRHLKEKEIELPEYLMNESDKSLEKIEDEYYKCLSFCAQEDIFYKLKNASLDEAIELFSDIPPKSVKVFYKDIVEKKKYKNPEEIKKEYEARKDRIPAQILGFKSKSHDNININDIEVNEKIKDVENYSEYSVLKDNSVSEIDTSNLGISIDELKEVFELTNDVADKSETHQFLSDEDFEKVSVFEDIDSSDIEAYRPVDEGKKEDINVQDKNQVTKKYETSFSLDEIMDQTSQFVKITSVKQAEDLIKDIVKHQHTGEKENETVEIN